MSHHRRRESAVLVLGSDPFAERSMRASGRKHDRRVMRTANFGRGRPSRSTARYFGGLGGFARRVPDATAGRSPAGSGNGLRRRPQSLQRRSESSHRPGLYAAGGEIHCVRPVSRTGLDVAKSGAEHGESGAKPSKRGCPEAPTEWWIRAGERPPSGRVRARGAGPARSFAPRGPEPLRRPRLARSQLSGPAGSRGPPEDEAPGPNTFAGRSLDARG